MPNTPYGNPLPGRNVRYSTPRFDVDGMRFPVGSRDPGTAVGQGMANLFQGFSNDGGGEENFDGLNFTDPISRQYEGRINELYDQFMSPDMSRFDEAFAALSGPIASNPEIAKIIAELQKQAGLWGEQRTASLDEYGNYIRPRVEELRAPAFSSTQEAGRRVASFDAMERERQQAKQNVIAQFEQLGHAPTSGVVAQALADVDRRFDSDRAKRENNLLLEAVNIESGRKSQADQLMGLLQSAQVDPAMLGMITNALTSAGELGVGEMSVQAQAQSAARAAFANLAAQLGNLRMEQMTRAGQFAATLPQLQQSNIDLISQLFPRFQIDF